MYAHTSGTEHAEMTNIGIARGRVARIHNGRGQVLSVQHGAVWITQYDSIDDVCLDTGESFRIDRDGLTLVSHCGRAARALVTLSASSPTTPFLARRVATSLRRWWASLRGMPFPSTGWI